MRPTTSRDPARLPQKVMSQCCSILGTDSRRWRTEMVVNRKEPVQRSVPVTMIMVSPKGKI
jgi:hypothetical protein